MANIINEIEKKLPLKTGRIEDSGVSSSTQRITNELNAWSGRIETDKEVLPRLTAMWSNIDYWPWTTNTAWSAAFVSWIMRGEGFPGDSAHYKYVDKISRGLSPEWKAYSVPKNINKLQLNPGDILVRPRGDGTPNDPEYWYSHGAIVYRFKNGMVELVGGNASDTVKIEDRYQVDDQRRPTMGLGNYKIILKRTKKNNWQWALVAAGAFLIWKNR